MNNLDRWAALARTFHTLEHAPGVAEGTPPSPEWLDQWAYTQDHFDGVREAAQFALHLWNGGHGEWSCGDFNLRGAWQAWDNDQKAAFTTWLLAGAVFF
jgi:hypothetical protein